MNIKSLKRYCLCSIILSSIFLISISKAAQSQEIYESEYLYTVPWGDQIGEISLEWLNYEFTNPPAPYAFSPTGGYVISDNNGNSNRLTRYDSNGIFVAQVSLDSLGMPFPFEASTNADGYVLLCEYNEGTREADRILLLSPDLQMITTTTLPGRYGKFWPSSTDSFWIRYTVYLGNDQCEDYLQEIKPDGSLLIPQLLYAGGCDDPAGYDFYYIEPNGQGFPKLTDKYGCTYEMVWEYGVGNKLTKYSPMEEIVHSNVINDDPGWWGTTDYFITWDGDYYTQHTTAAGYVITKYDLHVDPVCDLLVITPRPHTGPSPVAVEFDASGTYDDDGDSLTYHWDFDGDKVFDEPIDDAYTGTPSNPTHEYTADYEGAVNLRVTDNYQGECDVAVILSVDVQ